MALPRIVVHAWRLTEVRWATAATGLFTLGVLVQLADAPTVLTWTLYLACYAAGGWEPALEGLRALRERSLDVDLLMIVAAIGAAALGQVFDGALLVVIFATSGALESFATQRTEDSVRALLDLAPDRATRLAADGTETDVPAAELRTGDLIVVRPGQRIGGDGRVVSGLTEVDQASLTGEPMPVVKRPGDDVFAGSINGTGAVTVELTADAGRTLVARLVAQVAEASATKATTQLFIEKVEQRYSVGVVVATLAILAIPLALGTDLESALLRAMTFMIVASPCALVLATMPPLLATMANAGRHGVLVRSAVALERVADVDLVAFDKTGTLTFGEPVVGEIVLLAGATEDDVLALAAGAERLSQHPVGRAIVAEATSRGIDVPDTDDFTSTPGRGVTATVAGSVVEVATPQPGCHEALTSGGRTVVEVVVDDTPVAAIALDDRVRPTAPAAVRRLAGVVGHDPVLLSGDNAASVARVADAVGIEHHEAGLLPERKVEAVARLVDEGRRVMLVGDGVNDAPAMAAAHVGVAMGRTGTDLAVETADVVLVRDDLAALTATVDLARRARRVVQANLAIAATIIGVLVVWDLAATLPLPLGVAGHEGSTILVALNGLRLLRRSAWER